MKEDKILSFLMKSQVYIDSLTDSHTHYQHAHTALNVYLLARYIHVCLPVGRHADLDISSKYMNQHTKILFIKK